MDPQWIFYGLHKQLKNHFGIKLLKKERWTHITKKGNFDGMHNQLKNHFGTEFLKKEIFDGTHIAKKGNFDGLHE
jgi:hypothetical protein